MWGDLDILPTIFVAPGASLRDGAVSQPRVLLIRCLFSLDREKATPPPKRPSAGKKPTGLAGHSRGRLPDSSLGSRRRQPQRQVVLGL